jgi:hypothetical protein
MAMSKQDFAAEMARLTDDKLQRVIDAPGDYRPAAVRAAREEVARRGGEDALDLTASSDSESDGSSSRGLGRLWAAAVPSRQRFAGYPFLRAATLAFRTLALLTAVSGIAVFVSTVVQIWQPGPDNVGGLFGVLVTAVTVLGLLAAAELICVIVDIAASARRAHERLDELAAPEAAAALD